MSKYLIYLGFTGTAYRIAKFDSEDTSVRSLPVKDVKALPDVDYLNCTVIGGKPYPNLLGMKVLSTCPTTGVPMYTYGGKNRMGGFNWKELWQDKNREPEILTSLFKGTPPRYFYPGGLLSGFNAFVVWDGLCSDNNWYILGNLAVYATKNKHKPTASILCLSSKGELALFNYSDMRGLRFSGLNFIQAGTLVLQSKRVATATVPVVLCKDESKVLWHGRKIAETDLDLNGVTDVWCYLERGDMVCDLRKFGNAKVFGMGSVHDCSAVVFPESAEEVWLGFTSNCTSLKAVYLPATLTKLHDFCIAKRRIKAVTFYSDSPLVAEVAQKYGAKCVSASNADEMLSLFYAARDPMYVDVTNAAAIASLANIETNRAGEDDTIVSALLLSCQTTGFAEKELELRFPVIPSCDVEIPRWLPTRENDVSFDTKESLIRSRLLAAAFTLFYPSYDILDADSAFTGKPVFVKYPCGNYNVYISNSLRSDAGESIAFLEDTAANRVIHCFKVNSSVESVLNNLYTCCLYNETPCAILRYADKLPVMYSYDYSYVNNPFIQIKQALFNSFFPVLYETRTLKSQLVGIDLHTGCFVTAKCIKNVYSSSYASRRALSKPRKWFESIRRISNIEIYPEGQDDNILPLLLRKCAYLNFVSEKKQADGVLELGNEK